MKYESPHSQKKYTLRLEQHNLNLRTHIQQFIRWTICISKSEEMHNKIIALVFVNRSLSLS
ncbi:hypothetical protein IHE26_00605 [Plesiomonas shigelloides]|nr:hypothetical protein IHE26_00605 [Plesiomonas shigelloides]